MGKTSLRTKELRFLLDAVDRLYCPVVPRDFPAHLFAVLSELLPGTVHSFDFVNLTSGKVESHITPTAVSSVALTDLEAAVRLFAQQNPVVPHLMGRQPTAVIQPTDLVSQREFRHTDFYQHAFRPLEIEYQIAAGLAWSGHAGGFIVNRDKSRNFTAREVEVIRRLRPHVERAFAGSLLVAELRQRVEKPATSASESTAHPEASHLTARELEVLHWIARGKRDAEIATILGIAPRTVQKHVEHVLGKLHVETRTAAAAFVRGDGRSW